MLFVNIGPDSERQRENGKKSNDPLDLSRYQSLLSSFSAEVHTAKSSHFHNKINIAPDMRNLFRTFNSLLCPPSPPPTHFATFFTEKTKAISSQFSPPLTQDLQPTRSTAQTPIFSFCPLTESEVSKLLLSSHPTTCPLDPIPSHLLQAISPALLPALTHIINTSLLTGIFPNAFKQARVTPLLKKPTLNTSLLENYRPVSLLPFIAKTLERVVFNQVSLFLSQNNKLDAKQSGFRSGLSTETALLSVTESLRIAKADSKSSVLILLDMSAAFDTVNQQILCLHIEQPQAQHPPTSTHYCESTSPPEALPTSTHYYESTSPPEALSTSTHYYESTSPPEAPPTSTHYYESTSPPEAPPTSTHYYESTSPPEAPPTSTHYYESTSPPEAPPTSTHYYESTSPPEAPPTSPHYYESTSPPEAPPTSTHYYESTSPPEALPTSTHYYESTSPPEAPLTSTHYYESTSPPEALPTSTRYYESTSPPEALPTSTRYYESTSPPEAPPTSSHYCESISPPEAPPTSSHYYESSSPPEAPPTSSHYYESTSPPEAPPTSTHYYESTSPPEV